MKTFNCCFKCVAPKRHPGCHGTCSEYLEEKAAHLEHQAKRKEILDTETRIQSVYKRGKSKG